MNKKLLTMTLAVLLPLGLLAGSGDVNGDGKIDVADIVELLNHLNENTSEKFNIDEADVNYDGNVDEQDVSFLEKKIFSAEQDYIHVLSDSVVFLGNDNREFDIVAETDLDPYHILFDVPNNGKMGLWSEEKVGANWVYTWHCHMNDIKNYSGEDWEATIYLHHMDSDACDSVKVIFKSDEVPTLEVSPHEIEVKNKEYGKIDSVGLSYNYEWVLYEMNTEVLNNEEDWIYNVRQVNGKIRFEYDENYSGHDREAMIVVKNQRYNLADTLKVRIESGGVASLKASPKEITVKNKEYGRDFLVTLEKTPKWLEVETEYLDNEAGWLELHNSIEETEEYQGIRFWYKENYSGEDYVSKIVLKNEKYKLYDTVTVTSRCADWVEIMPDDLPERYVRAQKREYNLIGIGSKNLAELKFGMVLRTGESVQAEDIGSKVIGDNTGWLRTGVITKLGCYFNYDRNETGTTKTAKVVLYDKKGDYSDTVTVTSLPINFQHVNDQNHVYIQPDGDEIEFVLYNGAEREVTPEMEDNIFTDTDILNSGNGKYQPFIHHVSTEVMGKDLHIKLKIDPNTTDEHRWQYVNFPVRYTEECQSLYIGQAPKSAPSATEMRKALTDLYNSTNGPGWYRHENWATDKPLSQWDHLELAGLGDYVWAFDLAGCSLKGTIPENFGNVMEIENTWRIDGNGLYGRIPDAVINHPKWQEKGWSVVVQSLWQSERRLLEYDDLKLKLPTYEIDHVNGSLKTSDELFAKNKVNVVMIGTPSVAMGNLHLAYHNKGYGTIVSAYPWLDGKREDSEVDAREFPISDLDYIWNCDWADNELSGLRALGTWYVFDDKANLLACYVRDWDIPDEWYASKVDSICRKYLGEPEEHENFEYYTSRDYSKDGEVKQLQAATVGKGIDLVFVGECFTDKDMEDGGVYEQQMKEAMEQFFSEEPYTSLRNRFNVWSVKAVSPNEEYREDAVHAINYNDAKAFDYAKKAVGNNAENMMVNVIWKNNNGATLDNSRSYTSMYYGSYVAYNMQGGRVINHEGGGHGFAFLLDEYVEPGMENDSPSEDAKKGLDEIAAEFGAGANVDYHSDPSEVKWAKFITDERYSAEEIGVYEGSWLYGHGAYRPTENSMMRYNDCGFNAPSREAIYKRVMKLSEGDGWTYDYETFVTFDTPAREAYSKARSRARKADGNVQQRRIESRPPTIYKGTWRDAGKCEKVEYSIKQNKQ